MTIATVAAVVKNIARGAAALVVVAAAVKFLVTFSLSAALAIGVGAFALLCLSRSAFAPPAPEGQAAVLAPEGGVFGGLKRMLRYKDHDQG